MRRKPPYTPVSMSTDDLWPELEPGHYITTSGGSAYLVQEVRRGTKMYPTRVRWKGVRWPIEEIPADAVRHEIVWYPRRRKNLAKRPRLERADPT